MDSRLADIAAAATTAGDLEWLLLHRCGVARENLRVLVDPVDPLELGRALSESAAAATDVFVLYYIGHGLVSPGNELYLATAATDDELTGLAFTALPYQAVRDVLGTCRARSVLVVLDCCFAGRARGSFGNAPAMAFDLASFGGTYLLSAASATESALAPEGDRHTAFTGAVINLLYEGDPAGLPDITVESVYRHLRRELPRRGIPAPQRSISGTAGDIVLVPNPAAPSRPAAPLPVEIGPQPDSPCPYRGLDPFTADDSRYFFGRETALAELLAAASTFTDDGPIFLVGVSGVGKSSLLRAGFIPAIAHGELRLPGARSWPNLYMTPGRRPLTILAQRLAMPTAATPAALLAQLRQDPAQSPKVVADALSAYAGTEIPDGRLLLVVDQFEELFTTCDDEYERRAFITALDAASHSVALVLITVRADFYPHCMARPELLSALRHRQVALAPMTADQLRDAIAKPAAVAGLTLEPGLSDRLLTDLGADLGSMGAGLPLLSYALRQTWIRRQNSTLTLAGYQASGGIRDAVTQQADLAYASLDADGRRAARQLLLRMVHIGSDTEDTRRTVDLDELPREHPDETAAVQAACDSFSSKRLLVLDGGTARITHDALLRAWPRLRRWIDEDRRGLLIRQQLAEDVAVWRRTDHDHDLLYRGARLTAAREWSREPRNNSALSHLEKQFLTRSIRATRRNRIWALASVVVLLAAVSAGGIAVVQYRSATAQALLDDSVKTARTADTIRDNDPATALQLSLAAYRTAPTPQARAALLAAAGTPFPIQVGRADKDILRLAMSSDGHTLASSDESRTIHLWDIGDILHPAAGATLKPDKGEAALAFVPNTHVLLEQTAASLQLWDISDIRHPVQLGQSTFPDSSTDDIAVDSSGTLAAGVGIFDGALRLWDITDRRHPILDANIVADNFGIHAVAFDPQRPFLATGGAKDPNDKSWDNAHVKLWDITNPQAPTLTAAMPAASLAGLTFGPTGNLLVGVGAQRSVGIWDTTDPKQPAAKCGPGQGSQLFAGDMLRVEFDSDRTFVTSDSNGSVDRWTMDAGSDCPQLSSRYSSRQSVSAIAVDHDGQKTASGSADGTILLWINPSAPPLPGQPLLPDRRASGLGFSAGSKYFIDEDIWDVATPTEPQRLKGPVDPNWYPVERLPARDNLLICTDITEGTASLWDVTDFRRLMLRSTLGRPGDYFSQGWSISSDGDLLAVPRMPGPDIDVWDLTDPYHPILAATISGFIRPPESFFDDASDPGISARFVGARLLAVADGTGGVRLVDLTDRTHPSAPTQVYRPDTPTPFPRELLASDTSLVTTEGGSNSPVVLDFEHSRNPGPLTIDLPPTTPGITFLGSHVLAVAVSSHLEIWDLRSRSLRSSLSTGQEVLAHTLNASPDNHLLGVMTDDGSVHVWDVSNPSDPVSIGQTAGTHSPGLGGLVQFSPDSRVLAFTAGNDRTGLATQVVDLDPARMYQHLCSLTPHDLSPETWARYLPDVHYRPPCP
ncbi:AAA family ATPase [Nocardia sp. NPDC051570]|uniref:caspase, EACC1-associated type n=1 Tax=Nocardia sp. NPDC051570 TaxID=3364324 RepID=UPI003795E0E0